eukprot:c10478_g1_i1.p3 GENE.c10478_g1_i1~~c10478_g1_i1.p3  ORF type:complete len:121 (+),score=18.65 c10478_g1_i1:373-735(+)
MLDSRSSSQNNIILHQIFEISNSFFFREGRQFGRGKATGGQVRDEYRTDFDAGRGGQGGAGMMRQLVPQKPYQYNPKANQQRTPYTSTRDSARRSYGRREREEWDRRRDEGSRRRQSGDG